MDHSFLLEGLNEQQRAAVSASAKNLLILAGAGSGKTRVLVQRIAWLIHVELAPYHSILALTFTNKAAREMRDRLAIQLGNTPYSLWIGTFHSIAHRMLRIHFAQAKLPRDFQVIDYDDQIRIIKRIIRELELDEKKWSHRQAHNYIGEQKDKGLYPDEVDASGSLGEKTLLEIYTNYQEACDRAGLLDFNEILLRAHSLLQNNPDLQQHYSSRFKHILVDECQDTNYIQYQLIRLLAGKESNVMLVGDDDQSIYGWRGARVENVKAFLDDFSPVEKICLEQNYRSVGHILDAANDVIKLNKARLGKNLWTEQEKGEKIAVYEAYNDLDEARFVVHQIKKYVDNGGKLSDCAILYRNNAQSRLLEEALLRLAFSYRIYGGMRFFERLEIKDALAYLRLMNNFDDDSAFDRVLNVPTRGIGDRSVATLRHYARNNKLSLYRASLELVMQQGLGGRTTNALARFIELLEAMKQEVNTLSLPEQIDKVIHLSGLWKMYEQEKGEKGEGRLENLKELVNATAQFVEAGDESLIDETLRDLPPLQQFLSYVALESGERQSGSEEKEAVQLMTIHSAKGLEFKNVYIVGLEETIFPSMSASTSSRELEEERRLAYVGITRAQEHLTLTCAERRRLYGRETQNIRSRFLNEIPETCINPLRLRATVEPMEEQVITQPRHQLYKKNDSVYRLGRRVKHAIFGEGRIINMEGEGESLRVQIAFENEGIKWLVASFAKLEVLM